MDRDSRFLIAELHRKLENLVRRGVVAEVDADAGRARVRISDIQTAWLPWTARRAGDDKTWWAPAVGEHVCLMAPGGELEGAVIVAALNSTENPPPETDPNVAALHFRDGAVLQYDAGAGVLSAVLPAGARFEVTAPGGAKINADVEITGARMLW